MVTLPEKITQTMLKCFWTVLCTTSLTILVIFLVVYFNSNVYWMLLLLLPAFILPGYFLPEFVRNIYVLSNRGFRKIVKVVRSVVLIIIYYVFLLSLRPSAKKDDFLKNSPLQSMWESKKIGMLTGWNNINHVAIDSSRSSIDLIPFINWVSKTRKWRYILLIPFLLILSVLEVNEEKSKISTNTYTLY